jgi:hypothetical protein
MVSELPAMKTPTMNHRSFELRGMSPIFCITIWSFHVGETKKGGYGLYRS